MPSKHNPLVYFRDIVRAVELIQQYIGNLSLVEYSQDVEKQDAVERRLLVLAEAAKRLRPAEQEFCQDTDWRAIQGLGNRLRHEYDSLDRQVIWNIIKVDLPKLRAEVERVMHEHFAEAPKA